MTINGYELVNPEKLDRAINGTVGRDGRSNGGVGTENEDAIIAAYDKLGGLILKDGLKVKMGSFYDFVNKKPREEAEVSYMTEIEGEIVEVTEEEAKAVKTARKKIADTKSKKLKKSKEV